MASASVYKVEFEDAEKTVKTAIATENFENRKRADQVFRLMHSFCLQNMKAFIKDNNRIEIPFAVLGLTDIKDYRAHIDEHLAALIVEHYGPTFLIEEHTVSAEHRSTLMLRRFNTLEQRYRHMHPPDDGGR